VLGKEWSNKQRQTIKQATEQEVEVKEKEEEILIIKSNKKNRIYHFNLYKSLVCHLNRKCMLILVIKILEDNLRGVQSK
jgi:hypothetical protein